MLIKIADKLGINQELRKNICSKSSIIMDREYVTLNDLQCWLKYEYEQIGWITLCLKKGHPEKAYSFLISLKHLKNAIEQRQQIETSCQHIIRDLQVLSYKVDELCEMASSLGIDEKQLKKQICKDNIVQEQNKKMIRLSKMSKESINDLLRQFNL